MSDHPRTEVEHLLTDDQRRVTVDEHQAFRESISPPPAFDEIDEAAADPIHDHAPRLRTRGKINRVLGILDQLENSNRRCKP